GEGRGRVISQFDARGGVRPPPSLFYPSPHEIRGNRRIGAPAQGRNARRTLHHGAVPQGRGRHRQEAGRGSRRELDGREVRGPRRAGAGTVPGAVLRRLHDGREGAHARGSRGQSVIKVALPNKGQLFEPTMDILAACGYRVSKSLRSLSTVDSDNSVEFSFLRPGDIPLYVANGILDAGITGKDFMAEKGASLSWLLDLNYGHSKLCAAVPEASPARSLPDLENARIATSFPNIVRGRFPGQDQLVELEG